MTLKADIQALHPLDLIAYYPCDDSTGSVVADASGNGLNLSVTGSPTFGVAGPSGNAILFDGINASPLQSAQGSLGFSELPATWTVFWLHRRDDEQVVKKYWSISRLAAGNGAVEAFNGTGTISTDEVRWLVRNDANSDVYHLTTAFAREESEWSVNAMTYDGTTYNYYVDGHLDRTVIDPETQGTVTVTDLTLCGDRHGGDPLGRGTVCAMQHWAMWDRALTWREIRDLYFSAGADDTGNLLAFLNKSSAEVAGPRNAYSDMVLADGADVLYRLNEDLADGGFYFFDTTDGLTDATLGEWNGNTTSATFADAGPTLNGFAYTTPAAGAALVVPALGTGLGTSSTIEFWMKGTYQSGRRFFSTRVDAGGSFIRLLWETVGGNKVNMSIRDSDLVSLPTTRADWTAANDTWVHVALVITSSGVTLYLDGVPTSASQTWTGNFNTGWANFSGETSNGGASFTNGAAISVAEPAVYRGVELTSEQIEDHIDARSGASAGGGVGLLKGIIGNGLF